MTKELIWPFLAECTASVGSIIGACNCRAICQFALVDTHRLGVENKFWAIVFWWLPGWGCEGRHTFLDILWQLYRYSDNHMEIV